MKSCPSCGSEIVGRDAVEVLDEYREMVAKAKAADDLIGKVDDVQMTLWLCTKDRLRPESDAEDLAYDLRSLKEEIREASRELGAAGRRFREATRRVQRSF
jgi:predicted esterase